MHFYCNIRFLFILCFMPATSAWFFGSDSGHNGGIKEKVEVPKTAVPFEMKTTDEKFLLQAQFTKELSPLDACHHRVVLEIEETCSGLSEEDLGKLAVQLLNCQSQSENRRTYPCQRHMTIAECTSEMDSTTWNAYQIVSNRARAICYQTRQQQFRMKTEYTVNHLVHSAQQQLTAMHTLKEGQSDMIEVATDTLTKMKVDQAQLISQHNHMKHQQSSIQSSIAVTLRDLYQEKALIASGHKQFLEMSLNIRDKLDRATEILMLQSDERKENHRDILEDLVNIRGRTREVWHKIDDNSQQVLHFQKETKEHYTETLENLEKVNHTVNYVVQLINETRTSVEHKLNWMLTIVGASGSRLEFVTTLVLHVMYFLLAATSASFLRTPVFTRVLLLMLVPVNAWSQIKQGTSLGFLAMTLFIVLSTTANWVVGWMCYLVIFKNPASCSSKHCNNNNYLTYPVRKSSGAEENLALEGGTAERKGSAHNGLSQDDVHRLMGILQRMQDSGMLPVDRPDCDLLTPAESLPDQDVPVNTPISAALDGKARFIFPEGPGGGGSTTKSRASQVKSEFTEAVSSPRVELVRRHLMKTLADESLTESELEFLGNALPTPGNAPPTPGTPHSTPNNTPKRPRKSEAGLNRSLLRPQCLATTKAGAPCKISCVDGSAFCFRHQVQG